MKFDKMPDATRGPRYRVMDDRPSEGTMKFERYRWFWVDYISPRWGISLGGHLDWRALRLDLHILFWIISIGWRIPIYKTRDGEVAVSSSFHETRMELDRPEYLKPRR